MRIDIMCIVHSIIMQLIKVKTDCFLSHQPEALRFFNLALDHIGY